MQRKDIKEQVRRAFAARFCKALAEIGYSSHDQQALGRLFGISGQAVRKWAEGETLPTSSRMPQVAAVLGVRRAWLQDGEEPMRPMANRVAEQKKNYDVKPEQGMMLSPEEIKLVLQYRNLIPRQQEAIREMLSLLGEAAKRRKG